MTAHLTAAQARALGIDTDADRAAHVAATDHLVRRTTRRALPRDRAVSTCHACGATFTTDAAETRHVADTGHARYDGDIQRLPSGHER